MHKTPELQRASPPKPPAAFFMYSTFPIGGYCHPNYFSGIGPEETVSKEPANKIKYV